jgi:tellurite resistance protein TehA-like permease
MIFAFLALVIAFFAYYASSKDTVNEFLKYFLFFIAAVLLLSDTYTYVILPEQISSFYTNGLTYGNYTAFTKNDTRVAMFLGATKNDWVMLEQLKVIMMYVIPLVFLLLIIKWVGEHNVYGKKTGKP